MKLKSNNNSAKNKKILLEINKLRKSCGLRPLVPRNLICTRCGQDFKGLQKILLCDSCQSYANEHPSVEEHSAFNLKGPLG